MPTKQGKLNPRQARFVQEYVVDCNGTQAAIRAGYSRRGASQQASRLLANAKVQAALRAELAAATKRVHITQDMVLEEYRRLAFSDLRDVAKWGPGGSHPIPSEEITDEAACAVQSVTCKVTSWESEKGAGENVTTTVKMHDKLRALEVLARHTGLHESDADDGDNLVLVLPPWAMESA